MELKKYNKPRLTIEGQLDLLKNQGLEINDESIAWHVLKIVGYYRLSGYLLPFKLPHQDNTQRSFIKGTTFDTVWRLYQFDRELRLLLSDAIEKIEVAFRASISENISAEFGIFGYTQRDLYRDSRPYEILIRDINKILKDRQEVFIQHYIENYSDPTYPPIWMMVETLSLGACSKMFSNIKLVSTRRKICDIFNQHPTIIESWIKVIAWTRNLCAHHARLWNRWFVDAPIISKKEPLYEMLFKNNRRFIACAYIITQLLKEIAPTSHWKNNLFDLFQKYADYPGKPMGFLSSWQNDPFWTL
jgi:abortive infection bacteriophage resistance protein